MQEAADGLQTSAVQNAAFGAIAARYRSTDLSTASFAPVRMTLSKKFPNIMSNAKGASAAAIPVSNLTAVYLGGNVYLIRGKTSPGNSVRVSGREATAASDGVFQVQISAGPGTREVTIQASDSQGNKSQYRVLLSRSG